MSLAIVHAKSIPATSELVAVPVTAEDGTAKGLAALGLPSALLAAQGFAGKVDQLAFATRSDGRSVVLVGMGAAASIDTDGLRRAAARVVRAAGRVKSVALPLLDAVPALSGSALADAARAVAEGAGLGAYRFDELRSSATKPTLTRIVITGRGGQKIADAVIEGARIAAGQNLARDLVNRPGGTLTPKALAAEATAIARREKLKITVLGPKEIAERRLGGLLGVNRGSSQEPRFVEMAYEPKSPTGTLALVGKGITFDSGGLSIKSGEGMMTMKMDMGGAAAVLGFFAAVQAVAPRCRVVGYMPMTDNMSNGDATRPGDVLTMRNGTTVEVLNTDAEGRLILADALCLATEAKPDAIVDLATLTGAVEVALGSRIAAVLSNNDGWRDDVQAAAARSGERMWPLPLPDDYRPYLDSDVADLRNISKSRGGGTMTAGLFLQEFVGDDIPWAHIDIAGTAWWAEGDDAEFSKGGTGYGVRLLLELARTFSPPRR
jgi:leucyl aminopeptidase